ncbi:Type II secretion system (T2SS), protein F [Pseudobutyrivibrio sp. YE44]|uniref:type II secretion system F family protein n=1 Tax=Pseudobutyrivibrio sp. YE44 TaxID=1520802 RepID=UPI00088A81AA|nr:type II secretion system F family protein [Pseudobutyrivibrio sp. YE44]SDB37242.1 Type II secretion system (T2SS), protein F [Pseudobutyrivibrio sp. YE44]
MFKNQELTKKQIVEILLVILVMGVLLLVSDYIKANYKFDGTIERNQAGEGSSTEDLRLSFLDEKQEMTVEVSDKRLSKKQIDKAFSKAIKEIDKTYLGDNKSANDVTTDLDLRTSYVDGLIEAQWKFDIYGIIGNNGKLRDENIPEKGEIVNVTALLYYEEEECIYSFSVVVNQKSLDTLEGQLAAINREVESIDENTRTKSSLKLPGEVEGMDLVWKKKMDYRGLQLILLGFAAVGAILIGKRRDAAKAEKEAIEAKEKDYPMIVSELSILMGAGMSFRKALERISAKYLASVKNGGEKKAGFEEIVKTYRKMIDGLGEIQALEELGKNSESKEYRKLSMMLIQNLRKGSKELISSLEKEEKYAFEMRKQRALRAGEEASTKLLLPMAGMLGIVIVVLVVPAIMQL